MVPGESFTYRWRTPHRSTAGIWLLHDHSVAHHGSAHLGAMGVLVVRASGEQPADLPQEPLGRSIQGTSLVSTVAKTPRQADYVLVFHQLEGVGLCLNGRQGSGNTPALVVGPGTRMTLRFRNATRHALALHIHGHRWQQGDRWIDAEILSPGGGLNLALLSGSSQHGGGLGEWLIMGRAAGQLVTGSLVVTESGPVTLRSTQA